MTHQLILTVISDDRPGIVEQLANTISQHQGNWLDSTMSRLGGKFAGIVQIGVADEEQAALTQALRQLNNLGFSIQVADVTPAADSPPGQLWSFTIYGNDRPGIVREVTQAFVHYGINLEELTSECSSMPHVGTPLFTAEGKIRLPENLDISSLEEQLDRVSEELAVDIQLSNQ